MAILNGDGSRRYGCGNRSEEEAVGSYTTNEVAQSIINLRVAKYAYKQAIRRDKAQQNPRPGLCVNCSNQIEKQRRRNSILCLQCQNLEQQGIICEENLLFLRQMEANGRKNKPP